MLNWTTMTDGSYGAVSEHGFWKIRKAPHHKPQYRWVAVHADRTETLHPTLKDAKSKAEEVLGTLN